MSIYEQVEQEFTCNHPQKEIRVKYDRLNRPAYIWQCLTCGQAISTAIKKDTIQNIERVVSFDYLLEDNYNNLKKLRREELSRQPTCNDSFWREYNAYLLTDKWKMKRLKVLERDNYLCQACLETQATQAHHLTYKHVFNEPLFDLIAICQPCHDQLTELDRSQR